MQVEDNPVTLQLGIKESPYIPNEEEINGSCGISIGIFIDGKKSIQDGKILLDLLRF